ncbi:MAG TPA: von Willebrand factor type A domain-containing protein, partial [Longimicrobium sp.]|nr:von Willebrand factor type A domain-containing protein [Longimicrobium sp.]
MPSRLLALLALLLAAPLGAQAPAVVAGRVTDPTGAPVAAALVRIDALAVGTATTSDGSYRLLVPASRLPAAGEQKVTVTRLGYVAQTRAVRLAAGAEAALDFKLAADVFVLPPVVAGASGARRTVELTVRAVYAKAGLVTPGDRPPPPEWGFGRVYGVPAPPRREDGARAGAFLSARRNPFSTFSLDVDAAAYAVVRRHLERGARPPARQVRVEEMLNHFDYDYPTPGAAGTPFAVVTEVGPCPWNPANRLVQVGVQGRPPAPEDAPPATLVFLVDVSSSMAGPGRLPVAREALFALARRLRPEDRVAILAYGGAGGVLLDATPGDRADAIAEAIGRLEA